MLDTRTVTRVDYPTDTDHSQCTGGCQRKLWAADLLRPGMQLSDIISSMGERPALQPSVVILDVRAVPPSATSTLLECAANIRIVHVSLDSRVIAMYDRRELSATVQDFLDLVTTAENSRPETGLELPRHEMRNKSENAKL
jgi:hypothetical protein